ncbi:MAG TPA: outer membrane lipoprotein chaperone LolA [Gemmatimonadaceae bacterium]|nr:outer membrane lipoprotein chaperone LolA [Gemmatimonadaceae bacterium]
MNLTRVIAAASLAVITASPAAAQNQSVDRAVAAWGKIRSLSGTFEQTLTNPLVQSTVTAKGNFAQQRPNKLAVRFTSPDGDAIVADGANLWVYLQQAAPGQVLKQPISARMAVPIDVGQFLDAPSSKYEIAAKGAEPVGGRPAKVVGLTPKKGSGSPFTKATVWIDDADGLIRQFEVTEQSGVIRRIRLTSMNVNPTLGASAFRFTIPKGVKVVER